LTENTNNVLKIYRSRKKPKSKNQKKMYKNQKNAKTKNNQKQTESKKEYLIIAHFSLLGLCPGKDR
jgi:hypothetical protein